MTAYEMQEVFKSVGMPELERIEYREYGCTICQKWHAEDYEPELFEKHLMSQSKHGWRGSGRYYWRAIP